MLTTLAPWAAVLVVAASSTGLLIAWDWRWQLALLGAQYLGVAALVAVHWPLGMAAAKLVAGWMATAALGMTMTGQGVLVTAGDQVWPRGRTFRLLMAAMVVISTAAAVPRVLSVMAGVDTPVIAGALILSGMGLLQLGTRAEIPNIIFGLLTVLGGFEIFYAAVEGSILVAGLLAVVNLGLGLAGAYLLEGSAPEETE